MRIPATATLVAAGLCAAIYRLGRTYGTTRDERRMSLPGDDVVPAPSVVCTHATTVDAPPDRVWPWLLQVGWHRGGWYTPRWVDRLLFPDNWPSAERVVPELARLTVGDFVPDGAPETECGFTVVDIDPERFLLLRSTSHLPLRWRRRGLAGLEWTWVFSLRPVDGGTGTRFVFRWRADVRPWWLRLATHALIVPADLVMSRGMLIGIRRRAEGMSPPASGPRGIADIERATAGRPAGSGGGGARISG